MDSDEIDADARRVVLEANKARKFTDAANFSIRCTTCQKVCVTVGCEAKPDLISCTFKFMCWYI